MFDISWWSLVQFYFGWPLCFLDTLYYKAAAHLDSIPKTALTDLKRHVTTKNHLRLINGKTRADPITSLNQTLCGSYVTLWNCWWSREENSCSCRCPCTQRKTCQVRLEKQEPWKNGLLWNNSETKDFEEMMRYKIHVNLICLPGAPKALVTGLNLFIKQEALSLLLTTAAVEKDLISILILQKTSATNNIKKRWNNDNQNQMKMAGPAWWYKYIVWWWSHGPWHGE